MPLQNNATFNEPSQSSSRSSAVASVTKKGAASSAAATATSPNGEISSSRDRVFTRGATSSSGRATAIASDEGVSITVDAVAPISNVELAIDTLTGVGNTGIGKVDALSDRSSVDTVMIRDTDNVFYTSNGNANLAPIQNFQLGQELIQINGVEPGGYGL